MKLKSTEGLQSLLTDACKFANDEERTRFDEESASPEISWATIKQAASLLRDNGVDVCLRDRCSGSAIALSPPLPRQVSPDFRKQLDALAREQEAREYGKLIQDVVPKQDGKDILPTTRLQMGMGVHMAVTMGLGWLLGHYAGRAFEAEGQGSIWKSVGGICGIIGALILETVLFIARSSGNPGAGAKYLRYTDPKRWEDMQKPNTVDLELEFQTTPAAAKTALAKAETKKER